MLDSPSMPDPVNSKKRTLTEEERKQRNNLTRRIYYQKNKAKEQASSRQRYYSRKAIKQKPPSSPSNVPYVPSSSTSHQNSSAKYRDLSSYWSESPFPPNQSLEDLVSNIRQRAQHSLRARHALKPPPPPPNCSPIPIVQDQVQALKDLWASAQIAILDIGAIIHLHFSPAAVISPPQEVIIGPGRIWQEILDLMRVFSDSVGVFESHLDALVGRHIWRWDLESEKYLESDRWKCGGGTRVGDVGILPQVRVHEPILNVPALPPRVSRGRGKGPGHSRLL